MIGAFCHQARAFGSNGASAMMHDDEDQSARGARLRVHSSCVDELASQ